MKKTIIQKFGGSSVATTDLIKHVANRVLQSKNDQTNIVVVLSAMGDETDRLLSLLEDITDNPPGREYDRLLSSGENISIALLASALTALGHQAQSLTGREAKIQTVGPHREAKIEHIDVTAIQALLSQNIIPVIAGFQGVNLDKEITTLGRGGSDLTAVALAAALQAEECQIFTDVDGVYTDDPRKNPDASMLPCVSYEKMHAMAVEGAQVLQARSVKLAWQYQVRLRVLSTLQQGEGTLIASSCESVSVPDLQTV